MDLTANFTRVAMPSNKLCPHCGMDVKDWHREWFSLNNQRLQFNKKAGADCPNPDCNGGTDLFSDVNNLQPTGPNLPVQRRSKKQAIAWAKTEVALNDYLHNTVEGNQWLNYNFEE